MSEEIQDAASPDTEHSDELHDLELDTQSRIFLKMREQNLELLRIATQVAGFGGGHPPLRPADAKNAMKGVWDIYAEFYSWIDPEESNDDEEEDDE